MYEAKFIGGGPLSRKKMMVRGSDTHIEVQKPYSPDKWVMAGFPDTPEYMVPTRGSYEIWAIDHPRMRVVYVWTGWKK